MESDIPFDKCVSLDFFAHSLKGGAPVVTTFERFEVEAVTIPVHPQPSFFETTRVTTGDGHAYVDHKQVQTIMTRPRWNFLAADRKARATVYSKRALGVAGEKPGWRPDDVSRRISDEVSP